MKKIAVNTLGDFRLIYGDSEINENKFRSPMMIKLLIYMLINRTQAVSIEELANVLWQDEEIDNPAGAIKNLMYRLRTKLKEELQVDDFIVTNRGSYQWNSDIAVVLDTEEMEGLRNKAFALNEDISAKKKYLERAVALYQGDFMPSVNEMHWALSISSHYHLLYLECVIELCDIYLKIEAFSQMEALCNKAIMIDRVDTDVYYYLMLARIRLNKFQLAMDTYNSACKILREELGIRTPSELETLYKEILSMSKGEKAEKIDDIHSDMKEADVEGAYFCGYPVFKEIYRLANRKSIRAEDDISVFLLSFEMKENDVVTEFRVKNAMEKMKWTIRSALRVEDVVSQYSDSQYIIMLPSCDYDNGQLVSDRIINNFYINNNKYKDLKIKVSHGSIGD